MFGDAQAGNSDKSTNQHKRGGAAVRAGLLFLRGFLHLSPEMCNRNGEMAPCTFQASQIHC